MKTGIKKRIERLASRRRLPVYLVTFTDGSTEKIDVVRLLMHELDSEAGLPVKPIREHRFLRGEKAPYENVMRLVEATGTCERS